VSDVLTDNLKNNGALTDTGFPVSWTGVLEENGYRVLAADDGPEAVAIFAGEMNSISAVVTDMSLPLMDGVALIRSLRKIKPSASFIASTGQSGHARAQQLQEMGIRHLLIKPTIRGSYWKHYATR